MKKLTRREKSRNSQLQKKEEKGKLEKKVGLGIFLMGIVFSIFLGSNWLKRNQEINTDELTSIEGIVDNELKLVWTRRGGISMKIKLKEYPNIEYNIGRISTNVLKTSLLQEDISIGDKIEIDILRKNHDKINLDKQRTISVYGLRSDKGEYLNLNDYNWAQYKDSNSLAMYLLLGLGFWMICYGVYLYNNKFSFWLEY